MNKVDFHNSVFSKFTGFARAKFLAEADFRWAAFFNNAHFNAAEFSGNVLFFEAQFLGPTEFSRTRFSERVLFKKVLFYYNTDFSEAIFDEKSQVMFEKSKFGKKVGFEKAIFSGYVSFTGDGHSPVFLTFNEVKEINDRLKKEFSELDLKLEENHFCVLSFQEARLELPEKISFHTARLRPNWFVNTDPREMVFTDCRWENINQTKVKDRLNRKNKKKLNANINAELKALKHRDIPEETRLLEIACRQLAVNAEENNRYEEASKFRYMAMETKKLETPRYKRLFTLTWWYRLSSSYGESWRRAALILLGIWLAFAWAYTGFTFFITPLPPAPVGFVRWEKKSQSAEEFESPAFAEDTEGERFVFGKALWYSGAVMALQRPEPKPATNWTRGLIILETILGPLQAALLALAIRRKFMR